MSLVASEITSRSGGPTSIAQSQVAAPVTTTNTAVIDSSSSEDAAAISRSIALSSSTTTTSTTSLLKTALGLLLKHRGGPGFGHGRLTGDNLLMLEDKLREVVALLKSEVLV